MKPASTLDLIAEALREQLPGDVDGDYIDDMAAWLLLESNGLDDGTVPAWKRMVDSFLYGWMTSGGELNHPEKLR